MQKDKGMHCYGNGLDFAGLMRDAPSMSINSFMHVPSASRPI